MAQIKIYGERTYIRSVRDRLSASIHAVAEDVLGLPATKRFHRFIGLDEADFVHPPDRSGAYTIIEVSLFEGRSAATKRAFLEGLMRRISDDLGMAPDDLEITLFETPRSHWGIRGTTGDRLDLPYEVAR